MCNAYSLTLPRAAVVEFVQEIAIEFQSSAFQPDWEPRYRISPRQQAPVLLLGETGRLELTMAHWGFLISGGKPGFAPTNARADKLATGWPWKLSSKERRCLVPADGFFEPEKLAGDKAVAPWSYYTIGNRRPFWMGGLFNLGPHPKSGREALSYTIVTTDSNPAIRVHNRMPVILDDHQALSWITPGAVPLGLTEPFKHSTIRGWRVSDTAKNSRISDHEGMIAPLAQNSLFD